MPHRALIVGLGLIGGAAGMALRSRGWRVSYADPHVDEHDARTAGAADGQGSLEDGDHDLIVLATPVDVAVELLANATLPGPLITSVCSVMRPLRAVAKAGFIAGHPLAGSEKHGLAGARADLFEGRKWFVDGEHDLVDALIRDCGAQKIIVSAEEHDDALALTSHLPQVLSTALAAALTEDDVERFAGAGLATFLRLAGSDAGVWAPILAANRDNIRAHFDRIVAIARSLIEGDPAETFRRANQIRARIVDR